MDKHSRMLLRLTKEIEPLVDGSPRELYQMLDRVYDKYAEKILKEKYSFKRAIRNIVDEIRKTQPEGKKMPARFFEYHCEDSMGMEFWGQATAKKLVALVMESERRATKNWRKHKRKQTVSQ